MPRSSGSSGAAGPLGAVLRHMWRTTFVLGCSMLLIAGPLEAQSVSSSLSDLDSLQRSIQGNDNGSNAKQQPSPNVILQPQTGPNPWGNKPSRLEQIMSLRAGTTLKQFGYDQFGIGHAVSVPQLGSVEDSYVLGPGDEIVVSLRGQENSEYRAMVDRNGRVTLPKMSPVLAAGRTLGDFRQDVQNAVRRAFTSTQAFVAVGQLRQFGVTVSGEVNNPGLRLVTGLSTALDAILLSGGVKKTGSLRRIQLFHNGRATIIDLYDFLGQQSRQPQILLSSGDRIVIPPLGRTVAAVGWLRMPAIYELPAGGDGISIHGLIALAGGLEIRGRYRLSVMRVRRDGSSEMVAVRGEQGIVRDSEILFALPGAHETINQAVLSGGSPLAGPYSVSKQSVLSDVIKAPGALGDNPYTLFGLIVRRDPVTQMPALIPFAPIAILSGREDLTLYGNDVVRVFTANEARLLSAVVQGFHDRVSASEQALRNPLALGETGQVQTVLQGADQERAIIASLSQMTLDVGGSLTDVKPMNETEITRAAATPLGASVLSATPPSDDRGQMANQNQNQNENRDHGQDQYGLGRFGNGLGPQSALPLMPSQAAEQQQMLQQQQERDEEQRLLAMPKPEAGNLQHDTVSVGGVPSNWEVQTFGQLSRQLNIGAFVLVHFLSDNGVSVTGSVRGAGAYLVGPHVTLADLVAAAGGASGWTDMSRVELISTSVTPESGNASTQHRLISLNTEGATVQLLPHDEIHLNRLYVSVGAGTVTIQGQVRYPGAYDISRGEHLSEILLRSGGLTDVAYPYGTVFLRKSAAETEADGFRRSAQELQDSLTLNMTTASDQKVPPEAFASMQNVIQQMRTTKPLGRMSVVADPAMLVANPSSDPLLEAGDVIYIPQRPTTVTVLGQVLQAGSFPFRANSSVADYVEQAGGYNQLAEKSMTFLVLPSGEARRVQASWLNLDSPNVPPGSTIVVPRDLQPLDTRQLISDVIRIVSQLAITAASLSVLSQNN